MTQTKPPSDWAWSNFDREDSHGYERSDWQKDYEVLRDTVIQAFNPPDDDVAEPSLMTDTLDRAWGYIVAQPCACPPPDEYGDVEPCPRCSVLGRAADKAVER